MAKECKCCHNALFRDHVKEVNGQIKEGFVCMNPKCEEFKKVKYHGEEKPADMEIKVK